MVALSRIVGAIRPNPNSRVTKGHLESQATLTTEIVLLFESPDVLEPGFQ
jgi:hypothetical protein